MFNTDPYELKITKEELKKIKLSFENAKEIINSIARKNLLDGYNINNISFELKECIINLEKINRELLKFISDLEYANNNSNEIVNRFLGLSNINCGLGLSNINCGLVKDQYNSSFSAVSQEQLEAWEKAAKANKRKVENFWNTPIVHFWGWVTDVGKKVNLLLNNSKVEEYNIMHKKVASDIKESNVNTNDIVEAVKAIELYIWERGIDGNPLTYSFDMDNEIAGLLGNEITENQKGVCRNISVFVADVLKDFGYDASELATNVTFKNSGIVDIERQVDVDSINPTIMESTGGNHISDFVANHAIVVVDLENSNITFEDREPYDRFVYIDSTNLAMGYEEGGIIKTNAGENKVTSWYITNNSQLDTYEGMKSYMEDLRTPGCTKNKESLTLEKQQEAVNHVRELWGNE